MIRYLTSLLVVTLLVTGCGGTDETGYVPKPKGYNRIYLPPHRYRNLDDRYPYRFEMSEYAVILPDSFAPQEPNWIFVHYPRFNANIQLTYKEVRNDPRRLSDFIDDAYKLSGKHHIRASAVQEQVVTLENGKKAALFRLLGDVPSPYQFYTTDSVRNYLRGAVYLSSAVKNDSLAPVIEYLHKDMMHLLRTLEWKK